MTKTKLMTYLYDYRKMCTRMDVLAYRIRRAEASLDRGSGFIAGTQLGSPQITDMPVAHGSPTSLTERTAMVLMNDLPMADIDSLRADTQELESLKARKNMLDILLSALLERERFVIMAHLVSGLRWRETVKRYSDEYGDWMTEGALKYVMRQGLERMVEVSQQMNEA